MNSVEITKNDLSIATQLKCKAVAMIFNESEDKIIKDLLDLCAGCIEYEHQAFNLMLNIKLRAYVELNILQSVSQQKLKEEMEKLNNAKNYNN